MKNNKKGFTLIELLAVIVILAVIALIATPIVLSIITKARRSASQDSLYGVIQAAKTTYMETLMDSDAIQLPLTVTCTGKNESSPAKCTYSDSTATTPLTGDVVFSGTVPTSGSFTIDINGKVEATDPDTNPIKINGFTCHINADETVKCENK